MKKNQSLFIISLLVIAFSIASCCSDDDEAPIQYGLEFAIFDSYGEDNLFDDDGPYSLDSLLVFQDDAITTVEFRREPSVGGIHLNRYDGDLEEGTVQNTFLLHIPIGEVDTLVGMFNFFEGDRCRNSYWVLTDYSIMD